MYWIAETCFEWDNGDRVETRLKRLDLLVVDEESRPHPHPHSVLYYAKIVGGP